METKTLYPFILMMVLVGMLLGVGILTLDKFGQATRDSTTVTSESIAIAGDAGTTTYNNVTSVTFFGNVTQNVSTTGGAVNVTSTGVVSTAGYDNGTYAISYVYDASSVTTGSVGSTSTAISGIGANWLPLIVTIVALAIILGIVMSNFGGRRR